MRYLQLCENLSYIIYSPNLSILQQKKRIFTTFLRLTGISAFLFIYLFIYVFQHFYVSVFSIHPSIDENLGCSHFLVVMNSFLGNTKRQISLKIIDFSPFGQRPRHRNTVLYYRFILFCVAFAVLGNVASTIELSIPTALYNNFYFNSKKQCK